MSRSKQNKDNLNMGDLGGGGGGGIKEPTAKWLMFVFDELQGGDPYEHWYRQVAFCLHSLRRRYGSTAPGSDGVSGANNFRFGRGHQLCPCREQFRFWIQCPQE